MTFTEELNWPEDGLIPAVIQDEKSQSVLMLGFMNREALAKTQSTGKVHFWSRSRQALWLKGETSGNIQIVRSIAVNCELNSLLIQVDQQGAVCHTGYPTCYYREVTPEGELKVVRERAFDPADVYGATDGPRQRLITWWNAYVWLRDHDLAAQSNTSRVLRGADTDMTARIADELRELAGVLDGTHRHTDPEQDVLLEASQCVYWVVVQCLLSGITFDEVHPERAFSPGNEHMPPTAMSGVLRAHAGMLTPWSAARAHITLHLIATAVASRQIAPMAVIERDMSDLKTTPYLEPYFR